MIENGFLWLPEEAPWLADYLAELLAFPAWAKRKPTLIDYYRRLRER